MLGLKALFKLHQKKYRREYGCFVIEGKKSVMDAVTAKAEVMQLVMTEQFARQQSEYLRQPAIAAFIKGGKVSKINENDFARLTDTVTPQGVAAIVKLPEQTLSSLAKGKLIAVLEDIRDPGNLGTMIRTADWFGVDGLLLLGGADPYQPKVVRASMGSLFHLPIVTSGTVHDLLNLKENGFQIVVTRPELAGQSNSPVSREAKLAVVFGNEADGTSALVDEQADQVMSIPKFGSAESLNVAVSFGIVMHELTKQ